MAEDDRKIFLGGLSYQARDDDLRDHFSQFGELEMCSVKFDQETGKSRGFAFVVFADLDGVNKALEVGTHDICGRSVEAKLAKPKQNQNKVFVGGMDKRSTEDEVHTAFADKGYKVSEVILPKDHETGQGKGFAFVTFSGDDSAANTLTQEGNNYIRIGGTECQIKRAKNKNDQGRGGFRGGRGGGRDGGGGYGGGYGGGGSSYGSSYGNGGYGGGGYDRGSYDQYKMKGGRGSTGYHPY